MYLLDFPSMDHIVSSTPASIQASTVSDLIYKLVPSHAEQFEVMVDSSIGPKFKDTFKVSYYYADVHVKKLGLLRALDPNSKTHLRLVKIMVMLM